MMMVTSFEIKDGQLCSDIDFINLEFENANYFIYFAITKNSNMKKIKWPITGVTVYMIFYQFTPYIGFGDEIILAMFAVSPIPITWMVYKILKDGIPSQRSFDEYFYEDSDYKRNVVPDA